MLVVSFVGGSVERKKVDGGMDEDGDAAATLSMAISGDEVVSGKFGTARVVVAKLGLLKSADFDGVRIQEVAELGGGIFNAITVPLRDDQARRSRRRRARVRMNGGDEEEREDEATREWKS